MTRLRTRVVASLLLVAISACGDDGSDGDDIAGTDETTTTTEAEADEAATTTEAEAPADDVTAVPDVELLDAGTEPRVELRYDFQEGSVVSLPTPRRSSRPSVGRAPGRSRGCP